MTKRFDPARERDVMLALDIQGTARRVTTLGEEDVLESLCVVAASLSRAWDAGGSAFGIAAAGFTGTVRPFALPRPVGGSRPAGAGAGRAGPAELRALGVVRDAPVHDSRGWSGPARRSPS